MIKHIKIGLLEGVISIPASKSDAQRAYLAAALAQGKSVITGWGKSKDEQAMLTAIQQLGASVSYESDRMIIDGITEFPQKAQISAGESGLGIRLLSIVCAAHTGNFTITGEGSLLDRPMQFLESHLPFFGASCVTTNGKAPLVITGPMHGSEAIVDGSLSSQFISGLLMALPLATGVSELRVKQLTSKPYVDMTMQTLEAFGITVREKLPTTYLIPDEQMYHATSYQIDADWSSAGYWLVAAAIGHSIQLKGLRLDSFQADKALMSFLQAANCQVIFKGDTISVDGSARKAFQVDATDCPDLFPALVTLAAFCKGTSIIRGAARLVHKESHRGLTLQTEFAKLGVTIELLEDVMHIHGTGEVIGGKVNSHNDHRIAMCLAIAGTQSKSELEIQDAEAVAKSYPDFWKDLEELKWVEQNH